MDKTLEEFFESEDWSRRKTLSRGKEYYVWRKHGFEINEDNIVDNWGKTRKGYLSGRVTG